MSEGAVAPQAQQVADNSKWMYQIRKLKDALATASNERNAAIAERDAAKAELTDVKTKSDSSALHKRNQELEGRLRVIEHRKVMDKAALAKGVKAEALDAFYKLSEYEAKGDPNEEEIGAFVDSKVESLSFLIGEAEEEGEKPITKPAVGSGKSRPNASTATGFQLPPKGDSRWNDTKWLAKTEDQRIARAKDNELRGIVEEFAG